jgi:hypothetical protein
MKHNEIFELSTIESTKLENLFNIYKLDSGEYFYNILNTVNFDSNNIAAYSYDWYTIMTGDTYTYISYKHYNTINLWWLICSLNNIQDPTSLPTPGTEIKILKTTLVNNVLTTINRA